MLKKIFYSTIFLLVGVFGFALIARAENIDSFHVIIEIGKDGTANVSEYIEYNFKDAERHGIYRDIPLISKNGPDIAINVVGVRDELGEVPFTTSYSNGNLNIKIGDANKLVSGIKTYEIDYKVFGAIRFFNDHDEFYWNATGNDWQIPIFSATTKIFSSFNFLGATSTGCYTGAAGSTAQNCVLFIENGGKDIVAATKSSLAAGEGLTVSASLPKGEVDQAVAGKNYSDNKRSTFPAVIFGFIFALICGTFIAFMAYLIVMSGKRLISDSRLKGKPIVVQYNPPKELSLSEAAFVGHRAFSAKDISSVIIKLAVDGYIKIVYLPDTFFSKNKYELVKLKKGDNLADESEKEIFDYLFSDGKDSVKIDDLDRLEGSKLVKSVDEQISDGLLGRGFLEKSWRVKLSDSGVNLLWHIFGFAKFLEATEKEKLELMNAPELKPEIFEKFLPYAIVFGLEEKWAKKFETVFTAPPTWVDGYPGNAPFNVVLFAHSMSSFESSVANHSSYSSGSGGGGSSGGGSGGGGGGSW